MEAPGRTCRCCRNNGHLANYGRPALKTAPPRPVQQHIVDIIPRFRDPRHGTVPDAARSSVVGRQGKMIVTKAVELPPQIFGAASKVALHIDRKSTRLNSSH